MQARQCFQTLMSLHHAQIVNDSEGNVKSHLCFEHLRDNKRARGATTALGAPISCVMLNTLIVIKNA